MKKYLLIIGVVSILCSCMTQKTKVGKFAEQTGEEYKYSKGKQVWIFWGLIPLGRTNVNTPADGHCEIITRSNVGDILVSWLSGGIVRTRTTKVIAKRKEPEAEKKSETKTETEPKTETGK